MGFGITPPFKKSLKRHGISVLPKEDPKSSYAGKKNFATYGAVA